MDVEDKINATNALCSRRVVVTVVTAYLTQGKFYAKSPQAPAASTSKVQDKEGFFPSQPECLTERARPHASPDKYPNNLPPGRVALVLRYYGPLGRFCLD